jgi:hypothetical protein
MKRTTELLKNLLDSCESQLNALEQRDDVFWDCYNTGNWQSMVDDIKEVMTNLKMGGEQ